MGWTLVIFGGRASRRFYIVSPRSSKVQKLVYPKLSQSTRVSSKRILRKSILWTQKAEWNHANATFLYFLRTCSVVSNTTRSSNKANSTVHRRGSCSGRRCKSRTAYPRKPVGAVVFGAEGSMSTRSPPLPPPSSTLHAPSEAAVA